ncbi:MAG: hypothetical protein LC754_18560 [Acidobacteria bacterium]|nr:hypothetical protein [Acidobacteriota bacterium]
MITLQSFLWRDVGAARACLILIASLTAFSFVVAQEKGKPQRGRTTALSSPAPTPPLKRTATRKETRRLGYGGALTLYGAPEGSITVEGWAKSEVEITADVEISANTEEELARLAAVNGFVLDDDVNHLRVTTIGTHDRKYMKRVARDFPKKLLGLPWKIDYHVRVPAITDLEIYAGRGGLTISGVEGAMRLNAGEGQSELAFTGGDVEATIERGPVTLRVPSRNWRGRGLSLRLATGDLTVELPPNFNGDINAEVLRTGRIENSFPGLVPLERTQATGRSLQARAGSGGVTLSFIVGDGTLRIQSQLPSAIKQVSKL